MSAISETERYTLALREQVRAGTADHADVQLADRLLPGWRAEHPLGDVWLRHVLDVSEFRAEHGRFPKQSEPEGRWLHKRRQAAGRGDLSPERRALLDRQLPGWDKTDAPQVRPFEDHLANVVSFLIEYGRFPKQSEPEGKWLHKQRREAYLSNLLPERRAMLDQQLPGWDVPGRSRDLPFRDHLANVVTFRTEHGRLPKKCEPEGEWLRGQRYAAKQGTLSPDRRALLDAELPGWDKTDAPQVRPFEDHLANIAAFYVEHGRFPKRSEPEGKWLHKQRQAARRGTLSLERRALLDAELPDWGETNAPQIHPLEDHLDNVVAFRTEHGRLPKNREPEGQWLQHQRRAARKGSLPPERRSLLDQQLPGWNDTNAPQRHPFENHLANVAVFRAEHGRFPKQSEPEGMWLNEQRKSARRGKLSPERRALLDQQLPGWDVRA
ncbi:helicase associated domain-containing protein [Pseudoclavibacter soli]|uniref:helicase associated domain-containing protein n=1 Tax=Pseudoclavibacter soli TaxID=452623 RepID=UPI0003F68B5D|nr:helicase associated domain-containing protein [Pseudoclavibacter soli]